MLDIGEAETRKESEKIDRKLTEEHFVELNKEGLKTLDMIVRPRIEGNEKERSTENVHKILKRNNF